MWQRARRHLQERVSSLFFSHGLFCASHPFVIISLVIIIILMTSYPLTTLPLPGNAPLQYRTPVDGYRVPPTSLPVTAEEEKADKRPRWYLGAPVTYILQVVVKTTVSPWVPTKHIQTDAFRAPLSKAFEVVQHINNFQQRNGEKPVSLGDVCLHVFETVSQKKAQGLLPEYNCLTISPGNFWNNDKIRFNADGQIVKTVTKRYGKSLDLPPSIRDLLFGIPIKDTGIRSYFIRNRQRVISYAVTVLFKNYNEKFVAGLRDHLHTLYPLRLEANSSASPEDLVHVYFKDLNYFVEYTPLLVAYTVLFLYLYFSVRKIEMVKSKWGLALAAVVTVVSSLLMSIGICTLFGLQPSLNGSEIFPYLVVIIGLENVLVVTKSVVSTPVELDVKLRVARGLSKEGWSIFKNLMTELLILAVGFFTFVPAIQEFCLFAVVGLLSDFFLQMFFFTTVLSIDIRRMELSDLQKQVVQQSQHESPPGVSSGNQGSAQPSHSPSYSPYVPLTRPPAQRSFQYPKGSRVAPMASQGSFTDEFFIPDPIRKTPRRVRLMNYWARTRFMQRAIMVCVVIWIALIVYKTGLVEHLAEVALNNVSDQRHQHHSEGEQRTTPPTSDHYHREDAGLDGHREKLMTDNAHQPASAAAPTDNSDKYLHSLLTHQTSEKWRELSYNHWPTLLGYYNITMRGRYITVLPSISLSLVVSAEEAVSLRHPDEERAISHIPKLTPGLEKELHPSVTPSHIPNQTPGGPPPLNITVLIKRFFREPQSQTELVMTILLGIASFILFTYCMTTLYRCMCSRNYDKWRTNWMKTRRTKKHSLYYKQIREAVPLRLESHYQEVECLVTDGPLIVSACLGGQLCVWDSSSGERISNINRKGDPPLEQRSPAVGSTMTDSTQDLTTEYHERPKLLPPLDIPLSPSGAGGDSGLSKVQEVPATKPYSHTRHRSEDFGHRRNYSADFSFHQALQQQYHQPPPQQYQHQQQQQQQQHHHQHQVQHQQQQQQHQYQPQQQQQHQYQQQQQQEEKQHKKKTNKSNGNFSETMPDLTGTIDTDFQSLANQSNFSVQTPANESPLYARPTPVGQQSEDSSHTPSSASKGFDFSSFDKLYDEHRQLTEEKRVYMASRHPMDRSPSGVGRAGEEGRVGVQEGEGNRTRSLSQGDCPDPVPTDCVLFERDAHDDLAPAIWCLACQDSLIVAGCGNGRIEFWDGLTEARKYVHQDNTVGVTALCVVGHKVIAARLNGMIDFLELETSISHSGPGRSGLTTPTSVHKRMIPGGMRRTSSSGAFSADTKCWDDVIHVKKIDSVCAHQQPINILQSEGGRVVTASQDHTLKVFRVEDSLRLYTLHGHTGGVTALYLDKVAPFAAASGAEDGAVRLWDLMTGNCVHKLHGHAATVNSVTCTSLYVISVGMDDQLCVWERSKGHLLHWIHMEPGYCNTVDMLTSNLMVTGGQGCLHLWDVSKGEVLRAVALGDSNPSVFIRHLRVIANSTVVCDYGNQLRVIYFPAVLEKAD